jgi:hypothetical protein
VTKDAGIKGLQSGSQHRNDDTLQPNTLCFLSRYLQHLLRVTRLDALLVKHTEMSSEIKNLDSDMQMLVYENYNRFISATDTIRTMKSNVDGMDERMQELEKVTGVSTGPIAPICPSFSPLTYRDCVPNVGWISQ